MNTHEFYVSLEIAKLLKEVGFDWETEFGQHIWDRGKRLETNRNFNSEKYLVSLPTLDVARRWLREEKNINIEVKILSITSGQLMWYAKIYYLQKHNGIYDQVEFIQHTEISYDSYEQALEAGIKRALEIILEKGE